MHGNSNIKNYISCRNDIAFDFRDQKVLQCLEPYCLSTAALNGSTVPAPNARDLVALVQW